MRVLHLTLEKKGGAGIAAGRSVAALRAVGLEAELCDASQLASHRWIRWLARLDYAPLRLYRRRSLYSSWSNAWFSGGMAARVRRLGADVVHLHWVGHGLLSFREVERLGVPVVWTLHDAWAFTGGCHYPGECRRYEEGCGACPQLGSSLSWDLSRWNRHRRRDLPQSVLRWLVPSRWLGDLARTSGLIEAGAVRVVPNTLDLGVFDPRGRKEARRRLGIADNELVFAVGSLDLDEVRKGNHLLPEIFAAWRQRCSENAARLLIFGGKGGAGFSIEGLRLQPVGLLDGEGAVAALLAAADVLLLPSLQDNLPNVAVEAQACGCPVLGFDTGGLREIIEPGVTGWIVDTVSAAAAGDLLAQKTAELRARRGELAMVCRERAERLFSPSRHACALQDIYAEAREK